MGVGNDSGILQSSRTRSLKITLLMGFSTDSMGYSWDILPAWDPLVNIQKTMERSTMLLMGKSTISMVMFNSYFDITRG